VIVISVFMGMTKACGKIWLVTRTWVRSASISRSVIRRIPYSVCSTLMMGRSYSRMILVIGMSLLADAPRNWRP